MHFYALVQHFGLQIAKTHYFRKYIAQFGVLASPSHALHRTTRCLTLTHALVNKSKATLIEMIFYWFANTVTIGTTTRWEPKTKNPGKPLPLASQTLFRPRFELKWICFCLSTKLNSKAIIIIAVSLISVWMVILNHLRALKATFDWTK